MVSIHAPREGCDKTYGLLKSTPIEFQFTHPGRGATLSELRTRSSTSSFNSRTPGGVRPLSEEELEEVQTFQFTHPGRGATKAGIYLT